MMNGRRKGNKRKQHSSLSPFLLACLSVGRRSLSALELECLSFTHQTICFIWFIFSPSYPAQPDMALMMKRRGHPCIMSDLVCVRASVCECMCARRVHCVCLFRHNNVISGLLHRVMPVALSLTTCAAPRTAVVLHQ